MNRRYGRLELDWGVLANFYFDVISVVNLNFELTSPECAAAGGTDVWVLKWVLTMLLPVFAAGAVAFVGGAVFIPLIVAGVGPFADKNIAQVLDAGKRVWYQLLVMLYLPLTAGAFSVFGCRREESGRWVMDAAPTRQCYTASWWGLFVPGLIASLVYGFGLPGAVVWFLQGRRRELDDLMFVLRFGFLVGRFRDEAWWFEAAIMGRKMSVVLCMTLFSSDQSKAAAALVALVGCLLHVAMSLPYTRTFHNGLAVTVLSGVAMTLAGSSFEDQTARYTFIGIGIGVVVLGIVVGNLVDLWLIHKGEMEAEKGFEEDEGLGVEGLGSFEMSVVSMTDVSVGASGGGGGGSMGSVSELVLTDTGVGGGSVGGVGGGGAGSVGGEAMSTPPPMPQRPPRPSRGVHVVQ